MARWLSDTLFSLECKEKPCTRFEAEKQGF
jgi:hypothetical protein